VTVRVSGERFSGQGSPLKARHAVEREKYL